ncbi:MAG: type 4a pilus biogenesis protein PilO [Nitrosomonas sp.]|nr:type 4a pilus biogenesis protein PilO [Nitrosomonas sp.]
MSILEDLQRINPNDPGNWPTKIKVGALIILLSLLIFAGYFFIWEDQWIELETAVAEEETLRQNFLTKKRSAVNLVVMQQQLIEIEKSLGAMLKQLPNKSELDALLVDINRAGLGRGLQFELFKPAASELIKEFYAELPVTVRVTGNYHDIGAFASDVSQLSRIVTLHDIEILPGKDQQLVLSATAKTFRYLDDEELANQSKAQGGGKK